MKLNVFTIYDKAAETHNTPFFLAEISQAKRHFKDICTDKSTTLNRNPEDFILYHIGEYFPSTGGMESLPVLEIIAHATDYVNQTAQLTITE